MTYVTIDTKSTQAKKIVELLETLPFAKILKLHNVHMMEELMVTQH